MIWDAVGHKPNGHYYTQPERVQFATSDPLALPANTYIWLGSYDRPGRAAFNVANYVASEHEAIHITTAVINRLLVDLSTAI